MDKHITYKFLCLDIEDLGKFIKQQRAAIDGKADLEELRNIVSDQALINESLCTENILARWAWRTSKMMLL